MDRFDHIKVVEQRIEEYEREGISLSNWKAQIRAKYKRWDREDHQPNEDFILLFEEASRVLKPTRMLLKYLRIDHLDDRIFNEHVLEHRANQDPAEWLPIVVEKMKKSESYLLLDGNHRVAVALSAGLERIWAVIIR